MANHNDVVQSFCWKGDGSLLVTSSKVSDSTFYLKVNILRRGLDTNSKI